MEEQNGEITEYTFFITDDSGGNVTEGSTSELEVVVEELRPFHVYFVTLAASTRVGMGPLSAPSIIEMPQAGQSVIKANFSLLAWETCRCFVAVEQPCFFLLCSSFICSTWYRSG